MALAIRFCCLFRSDVSEEEELELEEVLDELALKKRLLLQLFVFAPSLSLAASTGLLHRSHKQKK